MIAAYADPPYIGQAARHYRKHPDYAGEVDHAALLRLLGEYECWALSCSSTSLQRILRLAECPDDVRIAAWVKPFAVFKVGVNPAYAWEPVVFRGARKRARHEMALMDWVSVGVNPAAPKAAGFVPGAKPERFSYWLFGLLGLLKDDELHDLFPGSGAVSRAWQEYRCGFLIPDQVSA